MIISMKNLIKGLAGAILILSMGACQKKAPVRRSQAWLNSISRALPPAQNASDAALRSLKADVKKYGNSSAGLKRIKRAEKLKKRTHEVEVAIDKMKSTLVRSAGGGLDPKTGQPNNPQNTAKVSEIMQANKAELIRLLDDYVNFLASEHKDLDLYKLERLTNDMEYPQQVTFYDKFYKNANVAEALSSLTVHQLAVRRYEAYILKKLGAGDLYQSF